LSGLVREGDGRVTFPHATSSPMQSYQKHEIYNLHW
jgi:hypothetical protein